MSTVVAPENTDGLKTIVQTHVEIALPSKIWIKVVALRTKAWEKAPPPKKYVFPVAFLVPT